MNSATFEKTLEAIKFIGDDKRNFIKTGFQSMKRAVIMGYDVLNMPNFIECCKVFPEINIKQTFAEIWHQKLLTSENLLAIYKAEKLNFVASYFWQRNIRTDIDFSISGDDIKASWNDKDDIKTHIIEDELATYLKQNLNGLSMKFEMSKIIGCGGESVVIEYEEDPNFAIKYVHMKKDTELLLNVRHLDRGHEYINLVDCIDREKAYQSTRPKELQANELKHKNIIFYEYFTYQYINDEIFHATGTFYIVF